MFCNKRSPCATSRERLHTTMKSRVPQRRLREARFFFLMEWKIPFTNRKSTSRFLPCPGYYKQCYDEHFIIARTWKKPRCPSADKWIRKLWYIYTMEYYSAIKKNTFDSVLIRWLKLEPIIQWSGPAELRHYCLLICLTIASLAARFLPVISLTIATSAA